MELALSGGGFAAGALTGGEALTAAAAAGGGAFAGTVLAGGAEFSAAGGALTGARIDAVESKLGSIDR
jgi:hypothetical protein